MSARVDHAQNAPALVWLRRDLRLRDNPALAKAAASGRPVACVYILDDETPGPWAMGGASRWRLHQSLAALARDLEAIGGALIVRRGEAKAALAELAAETGAAAVYWNRLYEPFAIRRDGEIKVALKAKGVAAESFNAALLFEPWEIANGSGEPYRVFTPFWRACRQAGLASHLAPAPARLKSPANIPSLSLADLDLTPTKPDWAHGLRAAWPDAGQDAARARLEAFLHDRLAAYPDARDVPSAEATSRLSPFLHFGEIGPREIVAATLTHAEQAGGAGADKFLAELGWREFSAALLFHFPDLSDANFQPKFDAFPWRDEAREIEAWRRGRTGYPIVDAGMAELWTTGYMHNRVRMIAGSFLVKHLLAHWRHGAAWFWDTLVDADLANNSASWQWVAGSGADAAPYFRIFNPVTQGERFDPDGAYVRRWLPALARLPKAVIHKPWEASGDALDAAGVRLGVDYPAPIVDHKRARGRALAAFETLKTPA